MTQTSVSFVTEASGCWLVVAEFGDDWAVGVEEDALGGVAEDGFAGG